ncbi:hypothetical protein SDC9_146156 [bioreactor metagenome]|uniref:Uncharacterized protein n=1 Tax=bioreactor metagenome TaxID=1076179 RepID=A0A645EBB8_9ZZZZ
MFVNFATDLTLVNKTKIGRAQHICLFEKHGAHHPVGIDFLFKLNPGTGHHPNRNGSFLKFRQHIDFFLKEQIFYPYFDISCITTFCIQLNVLGISGREVFTEVARNGEITAFQFKLA